MDKPKNDRDKDERAKTEREGPKAEKKRESPGAIQEQPPEEQHGRVDKRNREDDYGA